MDDITTKRDKKPKTNANRKAPSMSEEALNKKDKSNSEFRQLFSSINLSMALHEIIYDLSGRAIDYKITDINPVYERHTGISKKQAIGKSPTELYHVDKAPNLEKYAEVAATGSPVSFETYFPDIHIYAQIFAFSAKKGTFTTIISDITEHKNKEEELLCRAVIAETASNALYATDTNFKIVMWNKSAELLYGWRADEMIGKVSTSVMRAEFTTGSNWETAANNIRNKGHWSEEATIARKDGTKVTVIASGNAIRDTSGKIIGYAVSHTDITERKRAEETLAASETRYRRLFESAQDGILILDGLNGEITDVNPFLTNMLGYSKEELLSKKLWDIGFFSDNAASRQVFQELQDKGYVRYKDLPLRTKNGRPIYVEFVCNVYPIDGENVIQCNIRDITESKRIEDTLTFLLQASENNETFFNGLARHLSQQLEMEYVCIDQLEGDALTAQTVAVYNDGAIESNSRYALKDTPCGEAVGKTICCFPREVRKLFPKDAALQDLKAESYMGVTLFSADGKPIGLIAIIGQKPLENRDLAESVLRLASIRAARELERKQAEASLEKQYEKEKELRQEMESFSYSISHDLRAPLRALDGFSEAVLLDYKDKLDAQGQDYLKRIRTASQTMSQLINDMLKLSRILQTAMQEEIVDISQLVKSIADELQESQPERKVKFAIAPDIFVAGDPGLLDISLKNLLENAWKFTSKNPSALIEFGESQQNDEKVYFIKDNGVGFDMTYVDKLFQPFQRLHTDKDYPGTGIGLAIVKRIIRRHGGRIWADSEIGKGTAFYFTIGNIVAMPTENIAAQNHEHI